VGETYQNVPRVEVGPALRARTKISSEQFSCF
jgi:hypothetical protein